MISIIKEMNNYKKNEDINNLSDNTSNSLNVNENNKRCKKTRNKLTKKEQYVNERKEVIMEIYNLLKINEKNKTFTLYEIENSNEIKSKIEDLDSRIKKYFKVGNWNYYIQKKNGLTSPIIGLFRAILKDNDIDLTKKDISIIIDEKRHRTTKYYISI